MKKKSIDHTQLLLFKLLAGEDMYGYQIILELARRSSNVFEMKEGTLYPVLHGMERTGAKVDSVRLVSMRDQFAAEARQAQEMAWEYAGTEINLQSPKQLQKVLFEDMGLKPTKRTKSGSYTTNAAALQDLYVKSVDNERANGFLGHHFRANRCRHRPIELRGSEPAEHPQSERRRP